MFRFRKTAWIISLLIVVVIYACLLPGPVTAVSDSLDTIQLEGNQVQFSYTIDGYPKQTAFIDLETDLEHYGNITLWNIDSGEQFGIPDPDQTLQGQKVRLTLPEGWTYPVHVTLSGKVPTITRMRQCDGVILTKRPEKTTGFVYYRRSTLDSNGDAVGPAFTKTFDIQIPAEDTFRNRLNALGDDRLKNTILDMHDKGLTKEADALLSYAEQEPRQVPLVYMAGFSVLLILVVGLGGYVIGFRRGKGRRPGEETNEPGED